MKHLVIRSLARSAAIACLALPSVPVGPAHAQSLVDAFAEVYRGSPQLEAARAGLRATDEKVPQAFDNYKPSADAFATKGWAHSSLGPLVPFRVQENNVSNFGKELSPESYGIELLQPIYRGGRTEAEIDQAYNLVRADRAKLIGTEQEVFLETATAYMDVVQDRNILALNKANVGVLYDQLNRVRDELKVGEITQTDVSQAEAAYAQAVSAEKIAEGKLQESEANFERAVGRPPETLTAPDWDPPMPGSRSEAIAVSRAVAPNVVEAGFLHDAAVNYVRDVRGQLLPTLSLDATALRVKDSLPISRRTNEYAVVAELSIPLYDHGITYSQSRAAVQTAAQYNQQLDDARRVAAETGATAWDGLQSTKASIVSIEAEVRSNTVALDGVTKEEQVGARTVSDVLAAEQALFTSKVNLEQARHDEKIGAFMLSAASGMLTARDLKLPVPLYDPEYNLEAVRTRWFGLDAPEPEPNASLAAVSRTELPAEDRGTEGLVTARMRAAGPRSVYYDLDQRAQPPAEERPATQPVEAARDASQPLGSDMTIIRKTSFDYDRSQGSQPGSEAAAAPDRNKWMDYTLDK